MRSRTRPSENTIKRGPGGTRLNGIRFKRISLCDELTANFDPTMRFKRSNSNLENFHGVFGVAAFSSGETLASAVTQVNPGAYMACNVDCKCAGN